MNFPDVCDLYDEVEQKTDEGRVIRAVGLVAGAVPCRVSALSLSRRQREYGQEIEATHEGWFPARFSLTQTSEIVVTRGASDPAAVGIRLRVRDLLKPAGRAWKVVLAKAQQR